MNKLISKTTLSLLFLILTLFSFSQESTHYSDSTFNFKNAVKGFFIPIPIPNFGISFSAGYEKKFSEHNAFDFGTYYIFYSDEMGLKNHIFCIMPAYKYFAISDKKFFNNTWFSPYLSFMYNTHTHPDSEDNNRHSLYYYGMGVSIGKRINLTKDTKVFLDIGLGCSYNIYDDKQIFSDNEWSKGFIPRPILQIGRKF